MLTISSSSSTSLPPSIRRPVFFRRHHASISNGLYRPRTILIEKPPHCPSYGFSIQTYGFASLNPMSTDGSACSLLSLSSESTASRQSFVFNSVRSTSSPTSTPPIQLVTYVDHVEDKSPAWEAGLRAGSVILSVNDQTVEHDDHEALVKRITETTETPLKLIIIQQNVNKQIELSEELQKLHRQLSEKQEEFEDLCRQEASIQDAHAQNETVPDSPSPRLDRTSTEILDQTGSFCHAKIPLDWRQSVTNFAHQQKFPTRTLATILNSSSSLCSSKYMKTRSRQRSLSLSTLVLQYSRSSILRSHPPSSLDQRRALSHEELVSCKYLSDQSNPIRSAPVDDSMFTSGCSLAMDLSRSFDLKNYISSSSSSSSSSSTSLNTNDNNDPTGKQLNIKLNRLKWKLRINKG